LHRTPGLGFVHWPLPGQPCAKGFPLIGSQLIEGLSDCANAFPFILIIPVVPTAEIIAINAIAVNILFFNFLPPPLILAQKILQSISSI
jgi:hypothetical protein